MSHYTVMVILDEWDDRERALSAAMAPFQENNMGDCPRQYLEFNSVEEEGRDEYEKGTKTMVKMPGGELCEWGADRFYRLATPEEIKMIEAGKFDRRRRWRQASFAHYEVYELPEGAQQVEVPFRDLMTFDEYMSEYCGYSKDPETDQYGYWINPNSKWDWYQVGGRWSGFFKMKKGGDGVLGERSLLDKSKDDREANSRVDVARKGDIDFEFMRNEAGEEAARRWDTIYSIITVEDMASFLSWKEVRDSFSSGSGVFCVNDADAAREAYHSQSVILKFNGHVQKVVFNDSEEDQWLRWVNLDEFNCSRDEYVTNARNRACVPYAILIDGEWVSKGEMGWFGLSADSVSETEWNAKVNELIDSLPDNKILCLVDCHT